MLAFRIITPSIRQMSCLVRPTSCATVGARFLHKYQITGVTSKAIEFPKQSQCRRYAAQPNIDKPQQERVYYGTLAPRMKLVKFFSLSTSLAGMGAQPILLEQGMKIGGTGMAVFLCTVAGFFTFVTPLLLHFITKKYVTELHYNKDSDEYTATTISLLLRKIETKFRPDDVTVPDVPGMFTSFIVKKKPLFIDPALFEDPEHYVRIMGYDKPIDFKLDTNAEVENKLKEKQK